MPFQIVNDSDIGYLKKIADSFNPKDDSLVKLPISDSILSVSINNLTKNLQTSFAVLQSIVRFKNKPK